MRKKIFTFVIVISSLSIFSCRETTVKEEKVVKEVERENEGVLERSAKKVDKEINEEIDKEIEKIGDDN